MFMYKYLYVHICVESQRLTQLVFLSQIFHFYFLRLGLLLNLELSDLTRLAS